MMKRKTKRALSMVLASSMMLSVSSYTAFAADYKDTVGHWSEKQVNLWSDYGVISGYDGLFRPDDSITRGEMAVIMDKVMKYQVKAENTFSDLDQNFYTDSVLKANQAGIMRGSDGAVRPKDNITREEASVLICQAFGIDPIETATSKFNDSDKVSTWAAGYVNALLQKGYISGKGDNNFDPQGNITRGEAVTMFNNIVKGFYHQAGTYTENITGNVVVNTPETVLKDMSVTGDIFVTQGVADGNLTLENVKAPTVIVRGGGVNSVKITGNSEIDTVKVEKQDGDVRVVTDGTAKVSNVYIKDGSKNSVLEGSMDKIQVDASNSTVKINNATIKELNVTKESAKVVLDEKSIVDKLTIAETAANASVEINGTAKAISVSAQNAAITTTKSAKSDTLTVTEKATNTKLELNGTITTVDTSAQGTSANVVADANITTIKVLEKAADAKLSVAGKVGTVAVDAPNVTTEVLKGGKVTNIESTATATGLTVKGSEEGAKVIVAKDVTGTIVNGKDVKGGETVTAGSGKATTIKIGGKDSKVDWGKTVTQGEVENPSGNQFVNPNNPNDEWNADDATPQKQPEGLEGIAPTSLKNDDGKITGTTSAMEYKLSDDSEYTDCTDTETVVPAPGTYDVRYKKTGSKLAGKPAQVVVDMYQIESIEIVESSLPDNRMELKLGTGMDFSQIQVNAKFTYGSESEEKLLTLANLGEGTEVGNYSISGFDEDTIGEQTVTITIKGYKDGSASDTFEVKVLNNKAIFEEYKLGNISGSIDKDNRTVTVDNVLLSESLDTTGETLLFKPEFKISTNATITINGLEQVSGETEVDFGKPNSPNDITYSIVAEDGTNETWTVKVTVKQVSYNVSFKMNKDAELVWVELTADGQLFQEYTAIIYANKEVDDVYEGHDGDLIGEDGTFALSLLDMGGYEIAIWANKDIAGIPRDELLNNTEVKPILELTDMISAWNYK